MCTAQILVPDLSRNMMADINLLIVKKHSIDSLDSSVRGLGCLIMNIAIAARTTLLVSSDLAR